MAMAKEKFLVLLLAIVANFIDHTTSFGVLGVGKKITGGFGVGFGAEHERRSDGHGEVGLHVEKNVFGLNENAGVGIGSDGQVNAGFGIGFGGRHDGRGQLDSGSHSSVGVDVEKNINGGLQGQGDVGAEGDAQIDNHSQSSVGTVFGAGKRITGGFGAGVGVAHERRSDGHGEVGIHAEKNVLGLNEQAGVGVGSDGQVNVGSGVGFGGEHDDNGELDSDSHSSVGVDVGKKITTGLQGQLDSNSHSSVGGDVEKKINSGLQGQGGAEGDAQIDNHSQSSVGTVFGAGKRITGGFGAGVGVAHERRSDGHGEVGIHAEKNVLGLNEQAGVGVGSDGQVNVGFGVGFGGGHDDNGELDSDSHSSVGVDVGKKITTGLQGQLDSNSHSSVGGDVEKKINSGLQGQGGAEGDAQIDNHSQGSVGTVLGAGKRITGGFGAGVDVSHERRSDGHGEVGIHAEKNVLGLNEQAGVGVGSDGQVNVGFGVGFGGGHDVNRQLDSDGYSSVGVGVGKKITTGLQGQLDSDSHSSVGGDIEKKITTGLQGQEDVGAEGNAQKDDHSHGSSVGTVFEFDKRISGGFGVGSGHNSNGELDGGSHNSVGVDVEKKINTEIQGQGDVGVEGDVQINNHSRGLLGTALGFGKKITGGLGVGFGAGHQRRNDGHGEVGVHVEKNVFGLNENAGVGIGSDGQVNAGFGIGFGGGSSGGARSSHSSDTVYRIG